ncbi:MAG: hypothetical protein ACYDBB_16050 [Armatimonadota bacterium]
MKIVAQSVVPTTPLPYLHLGYTAAAEQVHTNPMHTWTGIALVAVLMIVAGIFRFYRVSSRFIGSFKVIFWDVAAAFIIVIGFSLLTVSCIVYRTLSTNNWEQLRNQTQTYALILSDSVGPAMDDEFDKKPHIYIEPTDAWGRAFRYSRHPQGKRVLYIVASPGVDGRFDTQDDIMSGVVYEKRNSTANLRNADEINRWKVSQ